MAPEDFQQFAGVLPEPMFLISGSGRILAANPAVSRLLNGAAPVGRQLADLVEQSKQEVAEYLRRCARTRELMPCSIRWRSNGSAQDVRCDGAVLRPRSDSEEALILLRCRPKAEASQRFLTLNEKIESLSREIAGRKRAQAELHAQREQYRVTLASIGDAVIATDAEGFITFMNPISEAMTGWRMEDALGRPLSETFRIINEETRQPVRHPVEKVLATGKVIGLANHTVLIARDGTERPIDDSAAPIRGIEGRTRGVVLVFHDITERKRIEQEREALLARERRYRAEAEQASRLKDEFLATLSHELRTPLNAVLGWVQLLNMGQLNPEESRHALGIIERNVLAQTQLINDLLDVSRIISGKMNLEVHAVNLAEVIEAATDSMRPATEARNIRVQFVHPPQPLVLMGDADRLQQVVWNLLSNAIKFSPEGGQVEVRLERSQNHARVVVRDNGIGISPEFLPHVFDRFRQLDSSTTRRHGGLGLGLALVRQLVELHGGTVEAESEGEGRGATFTIHLPLDVTARQELEHVPAASHDVAAAAEAMSPTALPLQGLDVLVVDDEPDAREMLATVLQKQGADVRTAESVAQALELCRQRLPGMLISDIGMPDQDGYALLAQLQMMYGSRSRLPISVAVTAFARGADRDRALAAGFHAHIAKPVNPRRMVETLAQLSRQRKDRPSS